MSTSCPCDSEEGQRCLLSQNHLAHLPSFCPPGNLRLLFFMSSILGSSLREFDEFTYPFLVHLLCDQNKTKQNKRNISQVVKIQAPMSWSKIQWGGLVSNTAWWARPVEVWALMWDPQRVVWSWVSHLTSVGTEWDNVWGSPVNTEGSSIYMSLSQLLAFLKIALLEWGLYSQVKEIWPFRTLHSDSFMIVWPCPSTYSWGHQNPRTAM